MGEQLEYLITYTWDPEGEVWIVEAPALQGAITDGKTIDEARAMISDLINLLLDMYEDEGRAAPQTATEILKLERRRVTIERAVDLPSPHRRAS